jgi:hypothetical protein
MLAGTVSIVSGVVIVGIILLVIGQLFALLHRRRETDAVHQSAGRNVPVESTQTPR